MGILSCNEANISNIPPHLLKWHHRPGNMPTRQPANQQRLRCGALQFSNEVGLMGDAETEFHRVFVIDCVSTDRVGFLVAIARLLRSRLPSHLIWPFMTM